MQAEIVHVKLGPRSYDLVVTHAEPAGFAKFARQWSTGKKAFVVTDANAAVHAQPILSSLREAGFAAALGIVPAGEASKGLEQLAKLFDGLAELPADRRTLVVAVGGGVIGDLAGFAAATFNRGLPLLMVPTTLLAMVDSSVGGKVGINHPKGKNLIGAFHQPVGVWIDTATLATLPDREYRSGLAEVVKYGVILDAAFFEELEQKTEAILQRDSTALRTIVSRSCQLKAKIVEADEREENGLRAILNYGHTFAHAFETVAGYGFWLHGEAVAAGMICASRLAERRGLLGAEATARQVALLKQFGLPTKPLPWPIADLLTIMRSDKKTVDGRLRFVLPKKLGEAALFEDIPEIEVREVLEASMQ